MLVVYIKKSYINYAYIFPLSSGFFENTSDSYGLQVNGTPVPEPTTIALLGIGLAGFVGGAVKRRFKRVKK